MALLKLRGVIAIAACWAGMLGPALPRASAAAPSETQLKAVFLFNFVQFTEWPAEAFADERSPFVVGVLGHDPFGALLEQAIAGEAPAGRSLVVERYSRVEEIGRCHVLFVSGSEAPRMAELLSALRGRPILTVGDAENFLGAGGMIRFVTAQNRVRFHINDRAARESHLALSSKLLRSAASVLR